MFIHIFGFKWKPEATEADKARAEKEILAFLPARTGVYLCRNDEVHG